ncbi:MAG TPA: hypothetical protein VHN14_25720 [Kofleriaceae bacterium]|nr:hypothetical protein [Kofleriaceae bacterium]
MSHTRDLHRASEMGTRAGAVATGMTPGKRTLVEMQYEPDASHARAQEAKAGQAEPNQQMSTEAPRTQETQVTSVFRKGAASPETVVGQRAPDPAMETVHQAVAPNGSPTVVSGGGNNCQPSLPVLDWVVVEDGTNWRADVTAMRVSGTIHITNWPSNPSSMTVPNTANPVDNGNINNTTGSPNHWQAAIDDMADYDTSGGGAGPNWHSTAASTAHEWAHWNEDFLGGAIPAGNWTQTNADIDLLTVPKSAHADAAAARTALAPRVNARFNQFITALANHWNNVVAPHDVPGGGGRGYAAGARVLSGLISSVRSYATTKGWTATPTPAPGPGATPAPGPTPPGSGGAPTP